MLRKTESVRQEIIWHFNNPPKLHFLPPHYNELRCKEPQLDRDHALYALLKPRTGTSNPHPALDVFTACLAEGVRPLDYSTTTPDEWRNYFRFASDRLVFLPGGVYRIEADSREELDNCVNGTADCAETWFKEQLIPLMQRSDRPSAYLLGEPGSGKSTLLKYLINTLRSHLQERDVVFSRFEFLKFLKSGPKDQPLERKRANYVSYILLRDLLWNHGYRHHEDGTSHLTFWHDKKLVTLVDGAFAAYDFLTPLRQQTLMALRASLDPDTLKFKALWDVPPDVRSALVKYLAQGKSISIIVDGLDCISLEDKDFNSERFEALKFILESRPRLAHLSVGLALTTDDGGKVQIPVTLAAGTLFVMRDNTFFHYERRLRDEIQTDEQLQTFRVRAINPHVAIYNVVLRSTRHWANKHRGDPEQVDEVARRLMKAILNNLRFINRALKTGHSHRYILGLFCGSMRDLFDFLEGLLRWFIKDSLQEGALKLTATSSARNVLDFITGPQGRFVMRRRSYRILEILLFLGLPWFENAVTVPMQSSYGRRLLGDSRPGGGGAIDPLQDNASFCGVVDNIFNYHVRTHAPELDAHCAVEKIRIVQLLREFGAMNSDQLADKMIEELGYRSADLETTLTILVRSQMIKALVVKGDIVLSTTPRGEIVVDHLCKTMSYLEHVFHRTLFPEPLVRTIHDAPRKGRVNDWTAASIRNAFIMVTYLSQVEVNRARGRRVRTWMIMSAEARKQVIKSIKRILKDHSVPEEEVVQGPRRAAAAVVRRNVAHKALGMITSIISDWEAAGVATAARKSEQTHDEEPAA